MDSVLRYPCFSLADVSDRTDDLVVISVISIAYRLSLALEIARFCILAELERLNDLMESEGGKKKSSSSKTLFYEAPLGYSIEDIRPHGGIKKFRSAAYSNCARKPS
ncbi:hypothetical protein POTOM_038162 [Populus tomentosa]|uniref:Uncharacterized protein n=1 Tax=Populus tomentosa TaxID=118781 RepID=A0A8X8CD83_POPTO|nr:hypothetical protein POTOM_038162 [Populus tomentosa]